ncbi:MAG: hypothetical protein HOY76_21465 [Streptomyces sp.]|nr:hypothetical protein [Streptomyces sp.]
MAETPRRKCARCGTNPATRDSEYCRYHGGSKPRPRETTTPPQNEPPALCTYQPVAGEILATACAECGHALALHIGVDHCPVCELVQHNRQVQVAMATNRIEVHVTGVDERVLERTIERMSLRARMRGAGPYRR